jgi:hypothetical protein
MGTAMGMSSSSLSSSSSSLVATQSDDSGEDALVTPEDE